MRERLDLDWIAQVSGARGVRRVERVQSLWDGYGEVLRVMLVGADVPSVVVKSVEPKAGGGGRSDARKRRSYEVESTWYRTFAPRCEGFRVAKPIAQRAGRDGWIFVLEDLDAAGYAERRRRDDGPTLRRCLGWLAALHARFIGEAPTGLWPVGTYWHLATRPDELAEMDDDALRSAAPQIDARLSAARFRTIVHGDAKLANFCFAPNDDVAAVDFQYAGGGCGMKDVAYLLYGTADEDEGKLLSFYFDRLRAGCALHDAAAVEAEWRALYPLAVADFFRFLAGWSKGTWRADVRGQRRALRILTQLREMPGEA
jgi:aminoglycoside phosphotransferase (APT) family kinase protein